MYTTQKTAVTKLLAIAMTIAMALTMTVSAFAAEIQPYNADATKISGSVNAGSKTYSVVATAPSDATKVKFDATLYQKQLIGRKEISSMSGSASGHIASNNKSADIQTGKTYVIEVTAEVYSGGAWDTIEKTITVKT